MNPRWTLDGLPLPLSVPLMGPGRPWLQGGVDGVEGELMGGEVSAPVPQTPRGKRKAKARGSG